MSNFLRFSLIVLMSVLSSACNFGSVAEPEDTQFASNSEALSSPVVTVSPSSTIVQNPPPTTTPTLLPRSLTTLTLTPTSTRLVTSSVTVTPTANFDTVTPTLPSEQPESPLSSPTTDLQMVQTNCQIDNFTPSDSILDWPVYNNDSFGISVAYPPDFYFNTMDVSVHDPTWLLSTTFQEKVYQNMQVPQVPNIALSVFDNPDALTLNEWFSQRSTTEPFGSEVELEFPSFNLLPEAMPTPVLINDVEGLCFGSDAMGLKIYSILFPYKEWIVDISYGAFGPTDLETTFKEIVSTFTIN